MCRLFIHENHDCISILVRNLLNENFNDIRYMIMHDIMHCRDAIAILTNIIIASNILVCKEVGIVCMLCPMNINLCLPKKIICLSTAVFLLLFFLYNG